MVPVNAIPEPLTTPPHGKRRKPIGKREGADPLGGGSIIPATPVQADANAKPPREKALAAHPLLPFKIAHRVQREEIVKHRDKLVRTLGRMVSLDEAARDWIESCAAQWRAKFDSH